MFYAGLDVKVLDTVLEDQVLEQASYADYSFAGKTEMTSQTLALDEDEERKRHLKGWGYI